MTEEAVRISGCRYDLNNIPVKTIKIIDYKSTDKLSRGCIIGCPKYIKIEENPNKIFTKLKSMTDAPIVFGTFLYVRNCYDITSFGITESTIFYYIKFRHRDDCLSFHAAAKQEFNVCLYIKKISLKHIHEWRKFKPYQDINNYMENKTRMTECNEVPDINELNDYDLTQIINTPYGALSIKDLLNIQFEQKNVCYIADVPISMTYPMLISWFKQFGKINNLISNDRSVSIIYNDNKSALNAINYCHNFAFENNIKLSATYGSQKYCRWFLISNTKCKSNNCRYKHSWNIAKKSLIKSNQIDKKQLLYTKYSYDESKEKLRLKLRIIATKTHILPLDQLNSYFRWHFNENIHNLYFGKVTDLISYFDDMFCLQYDRTKNTHYMISKLCTNNNQDDIHKHCMENIKKLQIYVENYDDLVDNNLRLKQEHYMLQQKYITLNNNKYRRNNQRKIKFMHWLSNIVKLEQYLSVFKKYQYDDITMIEFLNEEIIKNDLQIKKKLHSSLLLKRVNEFKIMMKNFDEILHRNHDLYLYKQQLMMNGILTLNDLRNDLQNVQHVKHALNMTDDNKAKLILQIIHTF